MILKLNISNNIFDTWQFFHDWTIILITFSFMQWNITTANLNPF
jgi:hypothetical protein